MSNGLNAGGAPAQLVRDLGTPGAVQGVRAAEITQGPRLAAALATTFRQLGQDGAAQLAIIITSDGNVTVAITGVNATGALGVTSVSAQAVVAITGVSATGALGTPTVSVGGVNVTFGVTGVAATGALGIPTVSAQAIVAVTGVAATGALGTPTVSAGSGPVSVTVTPAGVTAAGALGTPTVSISSAVAITGVNATGALGAVVVVVPTNVTVAITGVTAVGAIGAVSVSLGSVSPPVGVGAGFYYNKFTEERIRKLRGADVTIVGVAARGFVGQVEVETTAPRKQVRFASAESTPLVAPRKLPPTPTRAERKRADRAERMSRRSVVSLPPPSLSVAVRCGSSYAPAAAIGRVEVHAVDDDRDVMELIALVHNTADDERDVMELIALMNL